MPHRGDPLTPPLAARGRCRRRGRCRGARRCVRSFSTSTSPLTMVISMPLAFWMKRFSLPGKSCTISGSHSRIVAGSKTHKSAAMPRRSRPRPCKPKIDATMKVSLRTASSTVMMLFLAHPVTEQTRRIAETGIVDQMGAGIGLADQHVRAADDFRHGFLVAVGAGGLELGVQSFF